MGILWVILVQFVAQLSLGMAVCMSVTSPRQVNSGFFRVHLWVIMGMATFASLAVASGGFEHAWLSQPWILTLCVALGILSYVGAVLWLYEQTRAGQFALGLVALVALALAIAALPSPTGAASATWGILDAVTSASVLGSTMTAMLLGHWYLNSPGMDLIPLRRLLRFMMGSLVLRALLVAVGLGWHLQFGTEPSPEPIKATFWMFLAFRWLSGILIPLGLTWMTWQTLKIPNTQSATGILYAGVILVFIGELVSQLLSSGLPYGL